MEKDIFAEVTRIEAEAEQILAQARSDRDEVLKNARDEATACREQSRKKLEEESRALREEHGRRLVERKASLEEDFNVRRARLDDVAAGQSESLADWLVSRFLEESR